MNTKYPTNTLFSGLFVTKWPSSKSSWSNKPSKLHFIARLWHFYKECHPFLLSFKHLFVSNYLETHPKTGETLLILGRHRFNSHLWQKHFHTTTLYFIWLYHDLLQSAPGYCRSQPWSIYLKVRRGRRYFSEWNGFCSQVNKILPLLSTCHDHCTNFSRP